MIRKSTGWPWRTAAQCVSTALLCGCYAEPSFYRGTASLQTNHATTELASQSVRFTRCPPSTTDAPGPPFGDTGRYRPAFVVVDIGDDGCNVAGRYDDDGAFRAQEGSTCTLRFADHARTLRVADAMVRYGDSSVGSPLANLEATPFGVPPLEAYRDLNHVEVQLAGKDTTDDQIVVFRFFGHAAPGEGDPKRCSEPWRTSAPSQPVGGR